MSVLHDFECPEHGVFEMRTAPSRDTIECPQCGNDCDKVYTQMTISGGWIAADRIDNAREQYRNMVRERSKHGLPVS